MMEAMDRSGQQPQLAGAVHVGVVHGVRSIHYVAAAETRSALMQRLADYVRRQVNVQLYPEDATVVGRLLAQGALETAVQFYFERVGERWDREWLDEGTVSVAAGSAVQA